MNLLAQSDRGTGDALIWSFILVVAILGLFGAVVLYRKWMKEEDTTSSEGFTLSDLRRLHKEGKMTTEEFEKAKTILIGSLKTAMDKPIKPPVPPLEGPRTDRRGFDVLPPEK